MNIVNNKNVQEKYIKKKFHWFKGEIEIPVRQHHLLIEKDSPK